jgi:hypothetical protein
MKIITFAYPTSEASEEGVTIEITDSKIDVQVFVD